MAIRLDRQEKNFRNELVFAADAKAVKLDFTLTNLFMLMRNDGRRVKVKVTKEHTFETMHTYLENLEKMGVVSGFKDNLDAADCWLRSNLLSLVNKGDIQKEKIASLRPVHLESYIIRNIAQARDYNTADQVYLMLRKQPSILNSLKDYLDKGWDNTTKKITQNIELDVDSVGILQLIRNIEVDLKTSSLLKNVRPVLEKQADLFCDDILRLLVYKDKIPRNVFIEYLRTLVGFHLSLYTQKLIHLLPKMIEAGTRDVEDDWSIIVDVTDDLDSKVSKYACEDMEMTLNALYNYIKSVFEINAVYWRSEFSSQSNLDNIDGILAVLKNRPDDFEMYYKAKLDTILHNMDEEDDRKSVLNHLQYETSNFDRYVQTLVKAKGAYQYKYYHQFIDNISQKNTDYGFLADGRSRKHPRRAVLGSRLLETLVQLLVLEPQPTGGFNSKSLSIDELVSLLRNRYGIIINGIPEKRFAEADVQTLIAFRENVDAFKNKLRQIGFYTDLSDAYILQKIRPRYNLDE
ncbi:hypothetical protein Barb6XT_02442 [Bacteroidales bacterium Barb6XT]|nr:hypothetical protein Barb6XT_02442 [Bacteroidales bacterium Barb6XT]